MEEGAAHRIAWRRARAWRVLACLPQRAVASRRAGGSTREVASRSPAREHGREKYVWRGGGIVCVCGWSRGALLTELIDVANRRAKIVSSLRNSASNAANRSRAASRRGGPHPSNVRSRFISLAVRGHGAIDKWRRVAIPDAFPLSSLLLCCSSYNLRVLAHA